MDQGGVRNEGRGSLRRLATAIGQVTRIMVRELFAVVERSRAVTLRWLGARSAVIRRLLAASLFGVGLGLTLVSTLTTHLHTCIDQVARVGTVPAVRTCDPMSITDAPMLVLLIGAGALLLPDLASFEIPGVLRIERKVEEQVRRQEEIIGLIQQMNVSQSQQVVIEIADLINRQNEKKARFTAVNLEQGEGHESDDTGP